MCFCSFLYFDQITIRISFAVFIFPSDFCFLFVSVFVQNCCYTFDRKKTKWKTRNDNDNEQRENDYRTINIFICCYMLRVSFICTPMRNILNVLMLCHVHLCKIHFICWRIMGCLGTHTHSDTQAHRCINFIKDYLPYGIKILCKHFYFIFICSFCVLSP